MNTVQKYGCVTLRATLEDPKRKRRFTIQQYVETHTEPESSTIEWAHRQTYSVHLTIHVEKTGFFTSSDPELIVDSCTHLPIDSEVTMLDFAHQKMQAIKRLYRLTEIDVDDYCDVV